DLRPGLLPRRLGHRAAPRAGAAVREAGRGALERGGPRGLPGRRTPGGAVPAMSFLEVRGLVSGYDRGVVLHGVDLDLAAGAVLGLLGRNGGGKWTLVMTLAGRGCAGAGAG